VRTVANGKLNAFAQLGTELEGRRPKLRPFGFTNQSSVSDRESQSFGNCMHQMSLRITFAT
jgi:hypothetical protein